MLDILAHSVIMDLRNEKTNKNDNESGDSRRAQTESSPKQ